LIHKESRCKYVFKRHGAGCKRQLTHAQRRWIQTTHDESHKYTRQTAADWYVSSSLYITYYMLHSTHYVMAVRRMLFDISSKLLRYVPTFVFISSDSVVTSDLCCYIIPVSNIIHFCHWSYFILLHCWYTELSLMLRKITTAVTYYIRQCLPLLDITFAVTLGHRCRNATSPLL